MKRTRDDDEKKKLPGGPLATHDGSRWITFLMVFPDEIIEDSILLCLQEGSLGPEEPEFLAEMTRLVAQRKLKTAAKKLDDFSTKGVWQTVDAWNAPPLFNMVTQFLLLMTD